MLGMTMRWLWASWTRRSSRRPPCKVTMTGLESTALGGEDMELDDRCEICGRPSQVVMAMVRLPNGDWVQAMIHIACEQNRIAKNRLAGARGMN